MGRGKWRLGEGRKRLPSSEIPLEDDPKEPLDYLVGRRLLRVECSEGGDTASFVTSDGTLEVYHDQDCCENVSIEDVIGDPKDLVGQVVVEAREDSNADGPEPKHAESYTWTFYNIRTTGGDLTIRWLGESNGYYSEEVECVWMAKEE